jgi:hypothetical protein
MINENSIRERSHPPKSKNELDVIREGVKGCKKRLDRIIKSLNYLEKNIDQNRAVDLFKLIRETRDQFTNVDRIAKGHRRVVLLDNKRPYKTSDKTGKNISNLKNLNNH